MNKVNNNFLDDEQTSDESVTDEIVEEIIEEVEEEELEQVATTKVLNKAIERIEQAKLYEALLNHQLFGQGSARPEVMKTVRKEVKEFVQFRLEVLLGIRADGKVGSHMASSTQQMVVKSPFTEEETAALKGIANKLISKGNSTPSINSVNVPRPTIQELPAVREPQVQEVEMEQEAEPEVQQASATRTRRIVKKNGVVVSIDGVPVKSQKPAAQAAAPAQKTTRPKRQPTNNISTITGQDFGQAANPLRPPVPMPSQSQMDNMNANLADQNLRGQTKLSSGLGQAMASMLKHGG